MKNFSILSNILLSIFATSFLLIQGCGDDDDDDDVIQNPIEIASIRFTEVDPAAESVTIRNFGSGEIDISDYQLCLGPGQYNGVSNYTTINGDLILSSNESVVIDISSGTENVASLPDNNGGLGLFSTGGQFGSDDPEIFKDYIQWGASDQSRANQAVNAGRWDDVSSFIDGFPPFTYTGTENSVGVNFWNSLSPENVRLRSGFIVNAQTPENTAIVKYFAELPTGDVDISDGTDFQQFFPVDLFDGAIYNARPDGSAGFSRIMVNGNEEVIEDAFISTVDESSFQIAIKDATTGVFHDRNTPSVLTVFDPSSMTIAGTINMNEGFVPGDISQRYQTFYFRDDFVYAPIRGNNGEFYDSLIVHIANVNTGSFTSTISKNTGIVAPFNDFGQNDADEMGNLYIQDQGDVFTFNPATLHKIPSGSMDFDPNYNFRISLSLNPSNLFLPTFRGFRYIENGLALALVAESTPQELLDLIASVGGNPANLSDDQIQQALGILFAAENGRWCTVDVNAQTVSIINGIPAQSVFATTHVMEANGLIYLPVTTPTINALYSYNPENQETAKVFDLIAGGALVGIYNLSNNH